MKVSKVFALGGLLAFSILHFLKIGFAILFIGTLKKIRFTKKSTYLIFLILSLLIAGSLLNGANISNVIGKIIKVFIILKFFESRYVYAPSNIFVVVFLIIHFIFSFFQYDNLDEGFMINRLSGFFYDSNFAGFTLLCLYLNKQRTFLVKLLIFLSILLTQSVGSIAILILIQLGLFRFISKNILLLTFILIHISIGVFLFFNQIDTYIINDYSGTVDMKVNSLFFRFAAINSALFTSLPSTFDILFGHGSGVASVIYGRTFHNYIFQTLYDHGLLFFFTVSIYLWKNISKRNFNILLIILASNLFYETIWSLGFLLFIILDYDEI
jgi:hypothetical protein